MENSELVVANIKFGNLESVKKDLQNAVSKEITYHEIPHADHSYRDPQTRKPIYEDDVIEVLKDLKLN
jgi:hypothetical protein